MSLDYSQLSQSIQDYLQNYESTFVADIPTFVEQAEQRIYNTVQFPSLRKNVTGILTAYNPYLACPTDFLAPYSLAIYTTAFASATGTASTYTITTSGTITGNIQVGQYVTGTGIGVSAYVTSISGTTVYLSVVNASNVSGTINFQGQYNYLLNKDVNYMREAFPLPNYYATPGYYALFGPSVVSSALTNNLSFIVGPTPDIGYSAEMHYYYYPVSIVQSAISVTSIYAPGSGYTNGTYYNTALTGGTGSGAKADIVVSGGVVTSVTISTNGSYFAANDLLTASLPGGSGFQLKVNSVNNPTGTSWLGQNFDSVLLYGALVEAYTFIKGEPDLVALYDKKYNEALTIAKRLGDGMERQDAYRSGQYRQAVT
jgi:hypothetical protein